MRDPAVVVRIEVERIQQHLPVGFGPVRRLALPATGLVPNPASSVVLINCLWMVEV